MIYIDGCKRFLFLCTYATLLLGAMAISGCASTPAKSANSALNAATDVADPVYETVVASCQKAQKHALDEAKTFDEWSAARDRVRGICDPVIDAFEAARDLQLTVRTSIGAAGACSDEKLMICAREAYLTYLSAKQALSDAQAAWANAKRLLESTR